MSTLKLYRELAEWWPLLSLPDDYAEEAALYVATINRESTRPVRTVLELGSGGGNNASHMKADFEMTLVDLSPEMLAVSRRLNPECEHVEGDMRTVRLDRSFDAVFVHDAIMYMPTEADLRAAIRTAAEHLEPGGIALFVPDATTESYVPSTDHGGHDGDGRSIRYLEWDVPTPDGGTEVTMVYVMRDGDTLTIEHDIWSYGMFGRDTWLRLIGEEGLEARALPFPLSDFEGDEVPHELFAGIKPA